MWNGYPIKVLGGTEVEIKDKKFKITPGVQKVSTDTSNIPMKKLNDKDREIFISISQSQDFEKYKSIRGESESVDKNNLKAIFKNVI